MRAGVALRPATPVSAILPLLQPECLVHCVDVLAVQPGFGGQCFDSTVLRKVEELRTLCPRLDIQVPWSAARSRSAHVILGFENCVVDDCGTVVLSLNYTLSFRLCCGQDGRGKDSNRFILL